MIETKNVIVLDSLRTKGKVTNEALMNKLTPIMEFVSQFKDPEIFEKIMLNVCVVVRGSNIMSMTATPQFLSYDFHVKGVHYAIIMCSEYVSKKTKNRIKQEIPKKGIDQTIADILSNE